MARERLAVMRDTNDGFEVARRDLELRGPGELLGTRQTGLAQMRVADLLRDADLLPRVQIAAETLLRDMPRTWRRSSGAGWDMRSNTAASGRIEHDDSREMHDHARVRCSGSPQSGWGNCPWMRNCAPGSSARDCLTLRMKAVCGERFALRAGGSLDRPAERRA